MEILYLCIILAIIGVVYIAFSLFVDKANTSPFEKNNDIEVFEKEQKKAAGARIEHEILRKNRLTEYDARNKAKAILRARRHGHLRAFWHGQYYPTGLYRIDTNGKRG